MMVYRIMNLHLILVYIFNVNSQYYISYDKKTKKCSPSNVCQGIDIKTIPFIVDHVLDTFVKTQKLFDTVAVGECLKNKRILLLGDSTMIEFANDLSILLSGLASDSKILEKYLYRTSHINGAHSHFDLMHHVTEDYFGNHHNMSISSENNHIHIISRYIGHYDIKKSNLGAMTLLEERYI